MSKNYKQNNAKRKSYTGNSFKQSMRNVAKELRKNFIITTYKKSFDDFSAGIDELRGMSSVVLDVLGKEEELTPTTAAKKVMDSFANNFPSAEDGENIFWSVDISASRCMIKTDKHISFGWKFRYNRDRSTGECTISDIEMQITILRENQDITDEATANGWTAVLNK